ncbi:CRTAC1 family protein [Pseudoalteromonas sp. S1727]|uniref:CRTAC1 family protein n=1 Tax=Pseudoalteromonas sp. S1727 TaxID=2066514 RepID=UPI0011082EFD|nr:CRTAC1 family protein [Pseudoalteromonas sp. S1727]TMN74110.1 CRTAC1 family protein [Pseudoalteromonas sp. S1727]
MKNNKLLSTALGLSVVFTQLVACQSLAVPTSTASDTSRGLVFSSATAIKLENKNRRKWDNPVIADFDQDGYADLLLVDHGYSVRLYWNNKGVYSKGTDLIVGDMHGIGVGDYDNDGKIDILIARGGGSGSNARNTKVYHFDKRQVIEGKEFTPALQNLRGRTSKLFDGDNDGDLDLLLMGFPSRNIGKQTENFVYKNTQGNLTHATDLPKTHRDGQKVLITDFNGDHIDDIFVYGDGKLMILQGGADLSYTDVSKNVLSTDIYDITGIAEIDYDNDGDFDYYLTRSFPLEAGDTFYDKETHVFGFYTKRGPFKFDDLLIGDTFNLVNYQSPYPDQEVFIGEGTYTYQFDGEQHSGQNLKLVSSNGLGWPDTTPKKGLYVGYIGNDTWRIAGNTFSPTTGVITSVKDYKATTRKTPPQDLLLKNNQGVLTDVSHASGLDLKLDTTGVAVADFDNNGWQDLFVVKQGNLVTATTQLVFLNQGDGTFKNYNGHRITSAELGAVGAGADAFDYDLDGAIDIVFANERGQWHMFKNHYNDGQNFALLRILNSPSGQVTAQGAIVEISACHTKQIRKVGASAAPYTQSFNNVLHVGLGDCQLIDNATVRFSNGETMVEKHIKLNKLTVLGHN